MSPADGSLDDRNLADRYLAAAAEAAPAWGIAPDSVEIISRSENVVCKAELDGGVPAVMRLHRPGYNSLDQMRSEVVWVGALAESGVRVPRPLPSKGGDYYVPVPLGDQTCYVGVIEWVDGEALGQPIGGNVGGAVGRYRLIGEVAAGIRAHSATWTVPEGFVRRRWDADGLVGEHPLWGRFWEVEKLSADQRELFAEARAHMVERLGHLSTGPERFGLIHADLHLGNLMDDGDGLTAIDFDDAGFGWFAHELAVALHPVLAEPTFPDIRRSLVDGYRSVHPFAEDEVELIDTLLAMRCMMIIGWLDARPELPVYRRFDRLAAESEAVVRHFLRTGTVNGWADAA